MGLIYGLGYIPANYMSLTGIFITTLIYIGNGILLCFYPLAGFLADNMFGRYKMVIKSLYAILITVMGISILTGAILVPIFQFLSVDCRYTMVAGAILLLLCVSSFVGFNANVIQFGMDQLYDSPGDHQSLFIHWFVWLHYLGNLVTRIAWTTFFNNYLIGLGIMLVIAILAITLLIISLCIACYRPHWFLTEPARLNPYKLVCQVSKFAHQHKVPVHRSAFTYCENELPSGLDLGKDKYGGPFTTEQVEDVKVFYGILKVLFALGPMFFLDIATDPMLYFYARHGSIDIYNLTGDPNIKVYSDDITKRYLLNRGLLFPLLIVLCIPLYICLLRPFFSRYIPGMLKRLGLGIVLMVISLICTFMMDTIAHEKANYTVGCMFTNTPINSTTAPPPFQDTSSLVIQRSISALSSMLVYIALYEFICSQSPHSMKGLLIGLSFAIRGVCETMAATLVLPFFFNSGLKTTFPSCGMVYYLVNIGVGVLAVLVFTCAARRYKYRERDEPCHVRRYVEDYYSNIGPEEY